MPLTGNAVYAQESGNQQAAYNFSLIDINIGLSQSQVNAFLKDDNGFMWIGTSSGLNRFDGYEIKTYKYNVSDSSSIRGNDILALYDGPENTMWIQTTLGFDIYDPDADKFYAHVPAYLDSLDFKMADVEQIYSDGIGNFWLLTGDGLVYQIVEDQKNIIDLQTFVLNSENSRIADVHQGASESVWVLYQDGLLQQTDISGKVLETYDAIQKHLEGRLQDFQFYPDSDGDIWIYAPRTDFGALYFQPETGAIRHFLKNAVFPSINNNIVNSIIENRQGEIWIGTDHGGINVVDKQNFDVSQILHNPEVENSLAHNSIYTLFKDQEGIVWVGTYKNGVNYYHPSMTRFYHYKNFVKDPESLPYDDINAFVEDEHGNLWIGTNGMGLIYFDRENEKFTHFRHDPNDPQSLSADVIVSLLIDSEKSLWIGTYIGGLNRYDGEQFIKYQHNPVDSSSIANNSIWEMMEDANGNLWIGTHAAGLELYDRENDSFIHYSARGTVAIHSNYIAEIEEDAEGNIWLGGGYGLDVIDVKTGKVRHYLNEPGNPNSLINNRILSILRDSEDNMWIGTQEGLSLYRAEQNDFKHFTMADGLPNNTVMGILEQDANNFWLSTAKGIAHMKLMGKGKVRFQNYDKGDGLQGQIFNESAAFKTSSDEMVFGGPNGFNIFDPKDLEENTSIPNIVFTDFQLFNESVSVGEPYNGRVLLQKSVANTESISLRHNENVFSIGFAALNFIHPDKNQYRYKLEGFDKEWLNAGNSRRVSYTNLDPGNYTFKVMASNNDGIWNEEGASVDIVVMAPFWRTNAAYALYFLLIVAAVIIGRRVMLQRAKARFAIQQERREAKQLHALDLMKIRFFTNISHEFRTPLTLILAPLERLLENGPNANNAEHAKRQYHMMQRNAKRLLNLVNQLLDFRKIEVEGLKFIPSEGNIVKFIEQSVYSFSELSNKKHIKLQFKSDMEALHAAFDMDKLEKILFNLLSNAFKFTQENGTIQVLVDTLPTTTDAEPTLKHLRIRVIDSGIGIPAEDQKNIFERFFTHDMPDNIINQGSGIGLSIVKEFVNIHDGTIEVSSEPGKGSCFTVILKVKAAANSLKMKPFKSAALDNKVKYENDRKSILVNPDKAPHHRVTLPKVLLIEDNEDFLLYLEDNLQDYFSIITAKNGREGWQKALSNVPDLVVSDVMMPEMNGMALCDKLKNDPRTSHIPVVLLTAHSGEESKLRGLKTGASDYITKPFNFELLLSRLNNLIKEKQLFKKVYEKKISAQSSEAEIVSMDDKLIQKAIQLVEANLSDPEFSVEVLSKELGMSRTYLYKKMVALLGQSPVEFIRKLRLDNAAQLLEKSQLSVAEVAYKVGFNNTKYFTKYFKAAYKVLPSQYSNRKNKVPKSSRQ